MPLLSAYLSCFALGLTTSHATFAPLPPRLVRLSALAPPAVRDRIGQAERVAEQSADDAAADAVVAWQRAAVDSAFFGVDAARVLEVWI